MGGGVVGCVVGCVVGSVVDGLCVVGSVSPLGTVVEPLGLKIAHEVITTEIKITIVSNLKIELFIFSLA